MTSRWALALAVMGAGVVLGGCIADDSAPNRRGIERPLLGERNNNAEKRETESPGRTLPMGGREFPGQSRGEERSGGVVTLAEWGPEGVRRPDLPLDDMRPVALPGRAIPVPDTTYVIDPEWGTVPALVEYPARPWDVKVVTYETGEVKHNPTYYSMVTIPGTAREVAGAGYMPMRSTIGAGGAVSGGSVGGVGGVSGGGGASGGIGGSGTTVADLVAIPVFLVETLLLPVEMVLYPPLSQVTSAPHKYLVPPAYRGVLPAAGVEKGLVPVVGEFQWGVEGRQVEGEGGVVEPGPRVPR